MNILWAILVGFVAGLIAKLITPGDPKPRGFILTTVLGIVGGVLATCLGQAIGLYGPNDNRRLHRRHRRRGDHPSDLAPDRTAPLTMTIVPTLTTERLILRPYRDDDFDAFAAMWSGPAVVVRFIGGNAVLARGELEPVPAQLRHVAAHGFRVLRRSRSMATGAFVGEVGFQERMRDIVPSMEGTIETGWGLCPSVHGKGFATEAVSAALAWADDALPGGVTPR